MAKTKFKEGDVVKVHGDTGVVKRWVRGSYWAVELRGALALVPEDVMEKIEDNAQRK